MSAPLLANSRSVSIARRSPFECGRSPAVLLLAGISGYDRLHRMLFTSTNSANGGLQSTPVSRPENRQRRVWVDCRRRSKSTEWRLNVAQLPFGHQGPVSIIEPPLIAAK